MIPLITAATISAGGSQALSWADKVNSTTDVRHVDARSGIAPLYRALPLKFTLARELPKVPVFTPMKYRTGERPSPSFLRRAQISQDLSAPGTTDYGFELGGPFNLSGLVRVGRDGRVIQQISTADVPDVKSRASYDAAYVGSDDLIRSRTIGRMGGSSSLGCGATGQN